MEKSEAFRAKNFNSQSRSFLTSEAKKAFIKLKSIFVKAPILNHFDLEYHIQIKMDVYGYAIDGILNQLILYDLDQWHLIAFFSKKMIPVETWYETHNGELLAIVKVFKTWKCYLKDCKHEVLVLTDHNNLQHFINTKNLSSK